MSRANDWRRSRVAGAKERVSNRRQVVEGELMNALEAAERRERLLHAPVAEATEAAVRAQYPGLRRRGI